MNLPLKDKKTAVNLGHIHGEYKAISNISLLMQIAQNHHDV